MWAGLFAVLFIAVFTAAGIGTRLWLNGNLNTCYALLSLFFSINLLICYWEACLYWRRDYIEERVNYWRERWMQTGRTPAVEFLTTKAPLGKLLSPTLWADAWATYSMYDDSYANRRTYGFNIDIANGFFTPLPSLILYAAFTTAFIPALFAGILGVILFWQWIYVSSVYWVSFFVSSRQELISKADMYIYIWGATAVWVLSGLLGLYVSIRLIVDGDYTVLGYL